MTVVLALLWPAVRDYAVTMWPQVVPNLWASLLCALPTWGLVAWHHVTMRRRTADLHRHLEHATGRPPPT